MTKQWTSRYAPMPEVTPEEFEASMRKMFEDFKTRDTRLRPWPMSPKEAAWWRANPDAFRATFGCDP